MAIERFAGNRFTGLSSDTKPTGVGGPTQGALFLETDTLVNFYYNGTTWVSLISGGVYVVKASVDFTSSGTQTIGSLPANADVIRTRLSVDTISDAATTVTVGDATNGASSYMTANDNDPESLGVYISETIVENGNGVRTIQATVGTVGTVGAGVCYVEYRLS